LKRLIPIILILTLMSVPVYADDLQDGINAYIQRDRETAMQKLLPLAEEGVSVAQYYIGKMSESNKWLRMSAMQGYAPAQFELGFRYHYRDCKKAIKWMQMAIDQNYPHAMEELGVWYWRGDEDDCVTQNFTEAARLSKRGAELGHPPAQLLFGRLYYEGEGVPQDYVMAHMWFVLGSIKGDETALYWREKSRKQMTPAQISEAQKLAREWMEEHGKK